MNNNISLKNLFIVIFILCLFPLISNAQGIEKNFIDLNYIEETGKAEMEITPDMIYLKIILSEKDLTEPLESVEKKMIVKLQEIGIDIKKDLNIKDFSSRYVSSFLWGKNIKLSKEYQLILHDGNTTAKVFIELKKLNISNIEIIKLEDSKIEDHKKQIKINAIKDAKEKAEYLTASINQAIGKAIFIQESDSPYNSNRTNNITSTAPLNKGSGEDYIPEIDLDFEKIKLEYSVIVRFELK